MRNLRILACAFIMMSALACGKNGSGTASNSSGSGGSGVKIAVIPKGTTHSFWKTVHAGADDAAKDQKVDIIWKGPVKENDRSDQIAMVQQFINQGVKGIVLAPLDVDALAAPVAEANKRGIPVVIIDSALAGTPGKDFASFVATNNKVSQSVAHLHTHVVPRTKGDGLRGFFWPRTKYASDDEAATYAAKIGALLP